MLRPAAAAASGTGRRLACNARALSTGGGSGGGTASPAPAAVAVLMCGLPGRMGHSVAEAVVKRWGSDALLPFSVTGADVEFDAVEVAGIAGSSVGRAVHPAWAALARVRFAALRVAAACNLQPPPNDGPAPHCVGGRDAGAAAEAGGAGRGLA